MSDFRARLNKLKEQRKIASNQNFKEVLEEHEKSKRPDNWEKKVERNLKRIADEEKRLEAEEKGIDYEFQKSLDVQADELERWDRLRQSKKREDPGFIDFEEASKRQYGRLVKHMKPDIEEYKSLKEKLGDETFYAKQEDQSGSKSLLTQDSKQGIERMAQDVNKQIEIRSKRSRRRKFDDDADVDYINERNMRFNQKLERFYGTHSEEIKQNFERGTAL